MAAGIVVVALVVGIAVVALAAGIVVVALAAGIAVAALAAGTAVEAGLVEPGAWQEADCIGWRRMGTKVDSSQGSVNQPNSLSCCSENMHF